MTTSDHPFADLPQRFPQADADAFMALFHALGRNYVDAVVLCLILEMHAETPQYPWISASYRDIAERSRGAFVMQAVQKSFDRLVQHGCLEVATLEIAGRRVRANVARTRDLIQQLNFPFYIRYSQWVLWVMGTTGNWTESVVLARLVDRGAHLAPLRITYTEITTGLPHISADGVLNVARLRRRQVGIGILQRSPGGTWAINTPNFQSLLSQEADAWIAAGSPEEPWMPGLRIAVSSGSIPGETAFVESAVRTL